MIGNAVPPVPNRQTSETARPWMPKGSPFCALHGEERDFFLRHTRTILRSVKTILDLEQDIFIVLEGEVSLVASKKENGQHWIIARLDPGGLDPFAVTRQPPDGCHYRVTTAATLLVIKGKHFEEVRARSPALDHALCAYAASKLADINLSMIRHWTTTPESRIITALYSLAMANGGCHDGAVVQITQEELSELVGYYREGVCRILGGMKRAGYILPKNRCIVIKRADALKAGMDT